MEDIMTAFRRRLGWCIVAVSIVACAVAGMAQGRNNGTDTGSFAALTEEIRQLRLAVQESTRNQTQTQALGVYLSAQQARLVQVAARMDSARKELDALTVRAREIADRLSRLEEDTQPVAPANRAHWEQEVGQMTRALKQELATVALQEQRARGREAELSQMLQVEDARWTDLISRLEQLTKR
jgi:chromosome segregation ATPase